jgi:hypothetical protein
LKVAYKGCIQINEIGVKNLILKLAEPTVFAGITKFAKFMPSLSGSILLREVESALDKTALLTPPLFPG